MRIPPYARPALTLVLMVLSARVASAQAVESGAARDSTARDGAESGAALPAACFRARPASECRGFVVLEAGVYRRLGGTDAERPWGDRPQFGNHVGWEIGYMANRGADAAVGGAVVVGLDGTGRRWGAKARYRRWLPGELAADVGAGLLSAEVAVPVTGMDGLAPTSERGMGATADVGLTWRGSVGVGVRADAVRARGSTAGAVYGGVQLASGAAVAGTVAAVVTVGALILLVAGGLGG